MGQQQLLLLVLGIVIVGLAVVIGVQSFEQSRKQADLDRYTAEAVRLATTAAAWREMPPAVGGGMGQPTFARLGLAALGFGTIVSTSPESEVALGGADLYSIWNRNTTGTHVAVINSDYDRQAAVFIYGPSNNCLVPRTGWYDDATGAWVYVPATTPTRP
ncbi:MAG TPA: hypothetical protein VF594_06630, partial [Rubricoccaceae bacterium]